MSLGIGDTLSVAMCVGIYGCVCMGINDGITCYALWMRGMSKVSPCLCWLVFMSLGISASLEPLLRLP
jgi:hypothetical protein